jgi:hypothetical protein
MNKENSEAKTLYAKLGRGILLYFWDSLVMSNEPIKHVTDFINQIKLGRKELTIEKSIKVLNKYNVTIYEDEIDSISVDSIKEMLFEVISFIEAVQPFIVQTGTSNCIIKGIGLAERNIIAANNKLLENHKDYYYQILITEYKNKSNVSPIGKNKFSVIEKEEFELLFESNKIFNSNYLENRLFMTFDEISLLRELLIQFIDGQYSKRMSIINADRVQGYGKLLAIKEYIEFLSGNKTVEITNPKALSSKNVNPDYPNLKLREEFHKNIEPAYNMLRGDFIASNYETFCGILINEEFIEKVRLSSSTSVAEMKFLLKKIKNCLNAKSINNTANTLFIRSNNVELTEYSFPSAKVANIDSTREEQLEKIADVIKSYE